MASFDTDTLRLLQTVSEVRIRTEKHPDTAVITWVVTAGDEVYLRSVRGAKGTLVPGPQGRRPRHAGGAGAADGGSSHPRGRR
jgi:hypothetical protein